MQHTVLQKFLLWDAIQITMYVTDFFLHMQDTFWFLGYTVGGGYFRKKTSCISTPLYLCVSKLIILNDETHDCQAPFTLSAFSF